VSTLVAAAALSGCGTTSVEPASSDEPAAPPSAQSPAQSPAESPTESPAPSQPSSPGQPHFAWPIPLTAKATIKALDRMPERLGEWEQSEVDRGLVLYAHPQAQLGIEASDLGDVFTDEFTAAEVVELTAADFDEGTTRSCSRPPYRCVVGESHGQPAMVWGHDRSKVVLGALWADNASRDLLAQAWAEAQSPTS